MRVKPISVKILVDQTTENIYKRHESTTTGKKYEKIKYKKNDYVRVKILRHLLCAAMSKKLCFYRTKQTLVNDTN